MSVATPFPTVDGAVDRLHDFLDRAPRLLVLTGAGVSTECGIPDYRDRAGQWKRREPIRIQSFMGDEHARRRYWARSLVGWRNIARARPGPAHHALAALEQAGRLSLLVTQNVDGLHRAAGSRDVVDLHGRLDTVECTACGERADRAGHQARLARLNPRWTGLDAGDAPDGDADLDDADFSSFRLPACTACGGILKPSVVFFGENVPRPWVERSMAALAESDALLVAGSSLMVYSGYRFVRAARRLGRPVAILNLGVTRGDDDADLKLEAPCGETLAALAARAGLRSG